MAKKNSHVIHLKNLIETQFSVSRAVQYSAVCNAVPDCNALINFIHSIIHSVFLLFFFHFFLSHLAYLWLEYFCDTGVKNHRI